jgi:hypothetical protein
VAPGGSQRISRGTRSGHGSCPIRRVVCIPSALQRDGLGVARLPLRASEAVFGRPLFQGLSFFTKRRPTPSPRMTYFDPLAKANVTHSYCVIALSSAGLFEMGHSTQSGCSVCRNPQTRMSQRSGSLNEASHLIRSTKDRPPTKTNGLPRFEARMQVVCDEKRSAPAGRR